MSSNGHTTFIPTRQRKKLDSDVKPSPTWETEAAVVAQIIEDADKPMPPHLRKVFEQPPVYLTDKRLIGLTHMVRKRVELGRPVDSVVMAKLLEFVDYIDGDSKWYFKLHSYANSPAFAEMEAERLVDEANRRDMLRILEQINANVTDLAVMRSGVSLLYRSFQKFDEELAPNTRPQLRTITESLTDPLPLRPSVIHGVLRRSDIMTLSAPPKVSKSWNLLAMGLCMHAGIPWPGHETERTPILYCNFELHASDWDRRIKVLCEALGIDKPDPEYFCSLNCRGFDTTHRVILPQIAELTSNGRFGAVLVDPSYLLYDEEMEENSNADIARLLRYVTRVATPGEFAVVFSGHFPKGNAAARAAIERSSGASTWGRYPDCITSMTPINEEGDNEYALEFSLRAHVAVDPRLIRWKYPLMVVDESVSADEVREMIASKSKQQKPKGAPRKRLTKDVYVSRLPRDGTYDITQPRHGVLSGAQEREVFLDLGYHLSEIRPARELAVEAGFAKVCRSTSRSHEVFIGSPTAISLWEPKLMALELAEKERRIELKKGLNLPFENPSDLALKITQP
ncbi:MAG: hypothetical protein EHM40_21315 [Chloroflexi bacterium]|nr:MAG: hypothetical protein EHM40_21315 [Chloroflexota bacterium]